MASIAHKIATTIAKSCGDSEVKPDFDYQNVAYILTDNARRCLTVALRQGFERFSKTAVYKVSPDGGYAVTLVPTNDANMDYSGPCVRVEIERPMRSPSRQPDDYEADAYDDAPNFLHAIINYAVLENKGRFAFYCEACRIASVAKTWRIGGGAHEDIGKAFKQLQKFPYHSAAKQCFTDDGPSDALCRKLGVRKSELAGLAEEIFMWVGDNI